jgi:hypothetical protein
VMCPAPKGIQLTMRFALVLAVAVLSAGCVGSRPEELDQTCPAIAAFANASTHSTVRSVELTNDWGGLFCKSEDENEVAIACKTCKHGDDAASKELCAYLMENTSTEFPDGNFKRALACLNTGYSFSTRSPGAVDRLSNRVFWSDHAKFTTPRIVVGIEYLTHVKNSPDILRIWAKRRKS